MPSVIDLGYVEYQANDFLYQNDSSNKILIKYQNLTKRKLQISTIETDCNCIVLNSTNNTTDVAPLAYGSFYIYYHPQDFGYTEKRILVFFKDFKKPKEILLKARVIQSENKK